MNIIAESIQTRPVEVAPRLWVSGRLSRRAIAPSLHVVLDRDSLKGLPSDTVVVQSPIEDGVSPGVVWLERMVPIVKALASTSEDLLIRCTWGRSRSVFLACAYLMAEHKMSCDEALAIIRRRHPSANPCDAMLTTLLEWEEELHGR